jgi:hypothetical protein
MLEPKQRHTMTWKGRTQKFRWINGIEYEYGSNGKKRMRLHVVECQEQWNEIEDEGSQEIEKSSRHVWISNVPLTRWNLHERCNLVARGRQALLCVSTGIIRYLLILRLISGMLSCEHRPLFQIRHQGRKVWQKSGTSGA